MKEQPKEITLCKLNCVLMPQGEVIYRGETIGWFKNLKDDLEKNPNKDDSLLDACKAAKRAIYEAINGRPASLSIVYNDLDRIIDKAVD